MIRNIALLAFSLVLILSCKKSEIGPQSVISEVDIDSSSRKVLISCEGNFGLSNSSLSLYDIENSSISNSVFQSINGEILGDVFQSMSIHGERIYLVINNSSKIMVIDTASYQLQDEISLSASSPRYLVANGEKAYVSNFAWNPPLGTPVNIDIIDLNSNLPIGTIDVSMWVEEMLIVDNKLYACGTGQDKIILINTDTDEIENTLLVGKEPVSIRLDADGNIWVLCTGGIASNHTEAASIWKIDPVSNSIIAEFTFANTSIEPSRLQSSGESIYWLADGVYQMDVSSLELPIDPIINISDYNAYGLGIDPWTNTIYVSDAKNYQDQGSIYLYDEQGILVGEHAVGVIPSSFLFY